MPLLLLPRGVAAADVIDASPAEDAGIGTQFPATSGVWRFSLEIAAADDSPDWYDITQFYVGDRYQRGADEYKGKYRASLASVQLQIDNVQAIDLGVTPDILAPWGQDTTDLFGVNLRLGAGLLMRASMVRVVAAVVVEWLPLWTGRVESWGDASFARGQTRVYEVSVVDTIADLANVPVEIPTGVDTWPEFYEDQLLPAAGWQFGVDIYGDPDYAGMSGSDTTQAAITRMDNSAVVLGLVWRSLRSGRLVIHPAPWDTIHVERYANPLLDVYPDGLKFSYTPDFTDIEYIDGDDQQPFGITRTVAGVLNSFVISYQGDLGPEVYATDDPVSTGRYGIRPYTASWEGFDPQLVDDLLADRAYAESQALPLRTTVDHEGFWPALAMIDHLDPVTVVHATSDDGLVVTGTGTVRNIVEERTVRDDGLLNWQSTVQIDLDSTETSEPLLPVEDLAFVSSESPGSAGPSSAVFTWTNPTQPSITPTEVQYRVLERSFIWTSKDYPGVGADGTTINWLNPGTYYTLQVRLIRRVDGVVTNFSVWRQVRFFTPNRIWPIPTPGTDPGDTDVIGIPPDDECDDFQIDLQENDGTGWVTVDTFTGAELTDNGDGTFSLTTPIPNSFFNDGSMYRFRSSCDGIDWINGPEFDPPDDWTDPCPEPPALSNPPFDDPSLLVYVPKICTGAEDADPDFVFNGMQIIEAVSGLVATPGDALAEIVSGVGDPTERALLAIDDPEWTDVGHGIVAYGGCPQVIGATGDKTITIRTLIPQAEDCVLGECAAMQIKCVQTTGGWRAAAVVYKTGSTITLPSATVLDEGTAYVIRATHELATGDIRLFVDDVLDNSVGGSDNERTINALPIWRVGAPPGAWVTDFALFGSVIAGTVDPADIPDLALWYDAADAASLTLVSGAVSVWNDKSGNSVHISQPSAGLRPLANTATQNGLVVIDFDGVDDFLAQTGGGPQMGSRELSFFVVSKVDVQDATSRGIFNLNRNGIGFDIRAFNVAWKNTELFYGYGDGNSGSPAAGDYKEQRSTINSTAYHQYTIQIDTSTEEVRMDGTGQTITTDSGTCPLSDFMVDASTAPFYPNVGRRFGGGIGFMDGKIGEILLYTRYLNSTERGQVEAYLRAKWATP